MCTQIAAQILADKSNLNATSADGKIGGRIGKFGKLLKMKISYRIAEKFQKSLLPPKAGACSSLRGLDAIFSLLHFLTENPQIQNHLSTSIYFYFSLELCREGEYFFKTFLGLIEGRARLKFSTTFDIKISVNLFVLLIYMKVLI